MPRYIVRYGAMRMIGVMQPSSDQSYARGTKVIVRTERGLEAGEVLCESSEGLLERLRDPKEGQILRAMTADDANELIRIHEQEKGEFQVCVRCIADVGLDMELVDVEHIFGGERVVVYYLADGRVDFRELVKRLAGEFQTRIEMRQIGVRDEAKLMADYGDCGKPVCCNTHLVSMPPVSMKMAKLQKATLDPTKISGRCGRLKCCLRYEYETYEEMQSNLPPLGSRVDTPDGRARVIGHEVLAGQLLVETDDRVRKLVDVCDVSLPTNGERSKEPRKADDGDAGSI
jgi:cell fate regulator YaaT (PSP1 superfamily)